MDMQEYSIGTGSESEDKRAWKEGTRVLGIAESFEKSNPTSMVAGVVMRGDFLVDGYGFCRPEVGGTDATSKLLKMYRKLERNDIRAWLLGGFVISWFNVVSITELYEKTTVPIVCVTYNPTEGIEQYVREYFPVDYEVRMKVVRDAGERNEIRLKSGYSVYVLTKGITLNSAKHLLNLFTLEGRVPEPIRTARLLAHAAREVF